MLRSFVPARLMACQSSSQLAIQVTDYNRVSRQESLACSVASFLLHIDYNITAMLYNQQDIDPRAIDPSAHINH